MQCWQRYLRVVFSGLLVCADPDFFSAAYFWLNAYVRALWGRNLQEYIEMSSFNFVPLLP